MKSTLITITILLIAALSITACGGGISNTQAPAVPVTQEPTIAPGAQNSGSTVQDVKIVNFTFTPDTITISPGTTVKWTNQDATEHTVTADDGSFDSDQLKQGQSFTFTFTNAGTFSYSCSNHPNMKGKVVVQGQ
jgi:plastocyanin